MSKNTSDFNIKTGILNSSERLLDQIEGRTKVKLGGFRVPEGVEIRQNNENG